MKFILLCNTGIDDGSNFSSKPVIKFLMRMKLVILLLTIACSQAWSNGYSQTITLYLKDASLETVFSEIRKQSPYRFIYTKEDLTGSKMVNIHLKAVTINEVMEHCLADQHLTYQIEGRHVIIKKRKIELSGIDEKSKIALIDVTGEVLNEEGEAVVGASVQVKGNENKGTSTDANGLFILRQIDDKATLIISSINIETHEIKVNGKSNLGIITVKTRVSKLDEVQIIGYGTNTQRYNVGSVSKITAEEIGKQPVSNPLAALQGRVPGLVVTSTSGLPGASFNIQIRGQNSLNPDPNANGGIPPLENPLFIIDGVPLANQNNNINQFPSIISPGNNPLYNNANGGIGPFNSINPDDIESIEVLRDADATAIYGSRGANGVIIITTKKGTAGKTQINFKTYTGISRIQNTMPMMNTRQYLDMRHRAFANDGIIPNDIAGSTGYAPDIFIYDTSKYTDWKDYFIQGTAINSNINASVSGGTSTTQFVIGAGARRETNIYPGDFHNDLASINFNISHQSIDKRMHLSLSGNYSYNENNTAGSPELLKVLQLEPNYPDLQDDQGNLLWEYKGLNIGGGSTPFNPLAYLKRIYSVQTNHLFSQLQLSYKIIPDVTIRTNLGFNSLTSDEYSAIPKTSLSPTSNAERSAKFGIVNARGWIIEPHLVYKKNINKGRINYLMGATLQQNLNKATQIDASGYQSDALLESISGATNTTVKDRNSQYKYNAIFARLNYIYNNTFIVNLSGRRDGSSRFGSANQFGNFGALGMGWIFTEMNFFKRYIQKISYGKIRVSLGSTGSDAIGDYQYVSRWSTTNYTYQGTLGYLPQNLANSEFKWAVTKKIEAGLEVGFFKDRILTNLIWYQNRSGNQLVSYPLPSQTGFPSVIQNWNAEIQNSGIEFQIVSNILNTGKLKWSSNFNISIPRNKLRSFPGIENSPYKNTYIIGKSVSVLNRFKFLGVNDTTGIYEFENQDKLSTYKPVLYTDFQIIGDLDPVFFGGWANTISYKGIELSFLFDFRKQLGVNYLQQVYAAGTAGGKFNLPVTMLNSWKQPGDLTEIQKLSTQSFSTAGQAVSSYFPLSSGIYEDASFIKLRSTSIAYNIPDKWLQKIKIKSCRFSINAQNLLSFDSYNGHDPETQQVYGIPPLQTIVAGLQLTF